jgi:hypothetical protein
VGEKIAVVGGFRRRDRILGGETSLWQKRSQILPMLPGRALLLPLRVGRRCA